MAGTARSLLAVIRCSRRLDKDSGPLCTPGCTQRSIVLPPGGSRSPGRARATGICERMAARRADRLAVLSKELDGALAVPTDVTDQTHGPEQPGLDQVIA